MLHAQREKTGAPLPLERHTDEQRRTSATSSLERRTAERERGPQLSDRLCRFCRWVCERCGFGRRGKGEMKERGRFRQAKYIRSTYTAPLSFVPRNKMCGRGLPSIPLPRNLTRPATRASTSSHSIVPPVTRPLLSIVCFAAVLYAHSCLSCSCIVLFLPYSARLNTRQKTCRFSRAPTTDLFTYNAVTRCHRRHTATKHRSVFLVPRYHPHALFHSSSLDTIIMIGLTLKIASSHLPGWGLGLV